MAPNSSVALRAVPAILDCYETERMPITQQVSRYAMDTSSALARQRGGVPDNIEAPGPEGDAARARVGQDAYDIKGVKQIAYNAKTTAQTPYLTQSACAFSALARLKKRPSLRVKMAWPVLLPRK